MSDFSFLPRGTTTTPTTKDYAERIRERLPCRQRAFASDTGTKAAPGFLRVVGPTLLAFADYKGNRQMLSTGNLVALAYSAMICSRCQSRAPDPEPRW